MTGFVIVDDQDANIQGDDEEDSTDDQEEQNKDDEDGDDEWNLCSGVYRLTMLCGCQIIERKRNE